MSTKTCPQVRTQVYACAPDTFAYADRSVLLGHSASPPVALGPLSSGHSASLPAPLTTLLPGHSASPPATLDLPTSGR